MNRREFTLVALAGCGRRPFSPVQLQKFLFILDRNVGQRLGGTGYNFQPYHYGPFDQAVYQTLEGLEVEDLAVIEKDESGRRTYKLSAKGEAEGTKLLAKVDAPLRAYFATIGDFVRNQSFAGLVSAIYRAYPDMKVNSVFN